MTASDKALEIVPARQGKAAYVKAGEAITTLIPMAHKLSILGAF